MVIRLGRRVVRSHYFTKSQTICLLQKGLSGTKRDLIHDSPNGDDLAKVVKTAPLMAVTPSGPHTYTIMHRTAETGILGVQGPKARQFVFDNPEELLTKKKKSRSKDLSRSVSPTKAGTPPSHGTGSSSSLSELSHSPELSFTMETSVKQAPKSAKPDEPLRCIILPRIDDA